MESRWYLFPGQSVENTKISDRAHALHITKHGWSNITRHLDRKKRIQEALDKEKAHKKWLKDESETMTKQWPNSIENIRIRKEKERAEEVEQEKQDKVAHFYALNAEQDEIRKEYVAKMRREIFQSTGKAKELTSALILSETLYERQKQLEFDDKLKEHEREVNRQYAEKVRKDALDEKMEKEEEQRKDREKRAEMGRILREQIETHEVTSSKALKGHREREIKDLMNSIEETETLKRMEHEIKIAKRRQLVRDSELQRRQNEHHKKIMKHEQEEMDQACELYAKTKERIDCMKKMREKELLAEEIQRRNELASKVAAVIEEKSAEEEAMLAAQIAERDAAEVKRELVKQEAKEQEVAMRIEDRKQYLERKAEEERQEEELKKWEMLNRIKSQQVMEEYDLALKKEKWQKVLEYRRDLLEQMTDECEAVRAEKQIEEELSKVSYAEADRLFYEYAQEVLELAERKKRPTYPIQKVIAEYKKKNAPQEIGRKKCRCGDKKCK